MVKKEEVDQLITQLVLFAVFPPYKNKEEVKKYLSETIFTNKPEILDIFFSICDYSQMEYSLDVNKLNIGDVFSIFKTFYELNYFKFIENDPKIKCNSHRIAKNIKDMVKRIGIEFEIQNKYNLILKKEYKEKVIDLVGLSNINPTLLVQQVDITT